MFFSGTVRDNLRYGKPDATDDEIWEALRLVSAEAIVKRMDKGLDSDVGEDGGMLSTGEKQLLSFARALLANPKILVLDEATASIDTVTEKAIQDAIKAEQKKTGVSYAEAEKKQKATDKEKAKAASEYSKSAKNNKIDAEKNEEIVELIKTKFSELDDDGASEIKALMKELGIKNFKESDEIPTKHLEAILGKINEITEA